MIGKVGLSMDQQQTQGNRPSNPRRRARSKIQIFKEAYLPFVLVAVAALVIIGVIIGIVAGNKEPDPTTVPTESTSPTNSQQDVALLLEEARQLALLYDYDGALAVLNSFQGNLNDYPDLKHTIDEYTIIKHSMVSWSANQVPNLSFHVLIADLDAALADKTYGQNGNNRYNRNFVTIEEFTTILSRLYENGYVLVDLDDFYAYEYNDSVGKNVYVEKQLQLPEGKKPFMLTSTHCNYYTYMLDSNHDGMADSGGAGFASKLCWDNGFYNEMVTSDGSNVTGAFDLVPLLENFIQAHPDFSYKGARAILALSGYDGIFGYRVTSDTLSSAQIKAETEAAKELVQQLKDTGYVIACYTYDNIDYSVKNAKEIEADILSWQMLIAPIVGETDIMVFAQDADIGTSYQNNEKFDVLYENGYRFFLGSTPFISKEVNELYVRHSRLMVTGSNLYYHTDWFDQFFVTNNLLDSRRSNIPE